MTHPIRFDPMFDAFTDHVHAPDSSDRAASSAAPRRGRKSRAWVQQGPPQIPIVDSRHAVVAWTDAAPVVEQGQLRHAAAERLLGGIIFCTQVVLTDATDIRRAGGPSAWSGAWRCLALCRVEHARGFDDANSAAPMGALPPKVADASAELHKARR